MNRAFKICAELSAAVLLIPVRLFKKPAALSLADIYTVFIVCHAAASITILSP